MAVRIRRNDNYDFVDRFLVVVDEDVSSWWATRQNSDTHSSRLVFHGKRVLIEPCFKVKIGRVYGRIRGSAKIYRERNKEVSLLSREK